MAAGRVAGWFDAAQDLDWYRLDLAAGQRVHVELQGGRLGDRRPMLLLLSPDGSVLQLTSSAHAGPVDLQVFSAVAAADGPHRLLVAAPATRVEPGALPQPYQLSVSAIAADAEPDQRAQALPLTPDQPRSASFDQSGDRDTYAVDLAAGQRVLFEVFGVGLQVSPFEARLYGPGDRDLGVQVGSSLSQVRFVARADEAGRHTLDLRTRAEIGGPATASSVAYTVNARLLPADDHPDGIADALPLAAGATASGLLDLPGDLDAFRVDLVAGQRYAFELAAPTSTVMALRLYDGAGRLLHEGRAVAGAVSALGFEPGAGGAYVLRAEAPLSVTGAGLGNGQYTLRTQVLPLDALPQRLGAAPALTLGEPRDLSFDHATDVDTLRFQARAGERFIATVGSESGAPVATAMAVVQGESAAAVRLDDRPNGTLLWTALQDGWQYLQLSASADAAASGAFGGLRRVTVERRAPDDHGDAPAVGTLLAVGANVSGRVDLGGDIDFFRVNLQAGARYRFSISIPEADQAIGVAPDLSLSDLAGRDLYLARVGAREGNVGSFVHTAEQSGVHVLRPSGVASYTLRVDLVAADDRSDLAAGAWPLDLAPAYQALGMDVQGGDAAEWLVGASRADQLRGGGGPDVLVGGPGNDLLDGGAGVDVARFAGLRSGYLVQRGEGAWTVQSRAATPETDTLVGIERIVFDAEPRALALDLDGHAGTVARLIGALFGRDWLQRADIVGIGLALLDQGMTPLELARAAAASALFIAEAGSGSNRDFVAQVYANVFGVAPSAADLQTYTTLLDRGVYSQASLALLAADSAPNLASIGLTGLAESGLEYLPG